MLTGNNIIDTWKRPSRSRGRRRKASSAWSSTALYIPSKVLSDNFLFNFFSNPSLDKSINNSRKFNSYHNLLELLMFIGLQTVFSRLKQANLIMIFSIFCGCNILANVLVTRGTQYKQFRMMMILSLILISTYQIPLQTLVVAQATNKTICETIQPEAEGLCEENTHLYFAWLVITCVFVMVRFVGIIFAYLAFRHIKKTYMEQETRKARWYEYNKKMQDRSRIRLNTKNQKHLLEDADRKL